MRIIVFVLCFICFACPPARAGEIVLGAIFELKGSQAPTAQEALNGALLAVKKINSSKDKIKIRLDVESVSGDTTGVLNGVNNLSKSTGIIAATGLISEDAALAATPAFQAATLPFMCTGAQADSLSTSGGDIFTLAVPNTRTGQMLAEFAGNTMQINNIIIIRSDLSDSSARQADGFARRFKKNGGKIMAEIRITEPSPDLSFVSQKLEELAPAQNTDSAVVDESVQASNADDSAAGLDIQKRETEPETPQVEAVAVFTPPNVAAKVLEQLKQSKQTYTILGGTCFDYVSIQKNILEYPATIYHAAQASMDRDTPLVHSFIESYKNLFGSSPKTGYAGLGFDSIMLLAAAQQETSTGIVNELAKITDFEGVCGKISFQGHSAYKPLYIIQIESGQKSMATALD
ncbi:ABC transporter substrate-binding protein [Maridesulfovibrio sp.]|uniref:ABC transporter substrate-binding protein n=1 Tax=Maridesulfovibrio sp. TaxID=2795000 RepID=UPI0029F5A522|nr:ABC transporter substrate-binding protein [Maridesulfovibrio sp.]